MYQGGTSKNGGHLLTLERSGLMMSTGQFTKPTIGLVFRPMRHSNLNQSEFQLIKPTGLNGRFFIMATTNPNMTLNTTSGTTGPALGFDPNESFVLNSGFRPISSGPYPQAINRYQRSMHVPPLTETTNRQGELDEARIMSSYFSQPEMIRASHANTLSTTTPGNLNTTASTFSINGTAIPLTNDMYSPRDYTTIVEDREWPTRHTLPISQVERSQLNQLYGYLTRSVKVMMREFSNKNANPREMVESKKVHALLLKVLPFLKKHFDLKSNEDYLLEEPPGTYVGYARCWYRLRDEFGEYDSKVHFTITPYTGKLDHDMTSLTKAIEVLSKSNSEVADVLSGAPLTEKSYTLGNFGSTTFKQVPCVIFSRPNDHNRVASFGMDVHDFWESTLNERY